MSNKKYSIYKGKEHLYSELSYKDALDMKEHYGDDTWEIKEEC